MLIFKYPFFLKQTLKAGQLIFSIIQSTNWHTYTKAQHNAVKKYFPMEKKSIILAGFISLGM